MEVDKLLKLGSEYLSEYLRVLIATLRRPELEFRPVRLRVKSRVITQGPDSGAERLRLNSKLVGFLFLSIFIGSVLNANVLGRAPAPALMMTTVIVVACWMLLGSFIYVVRRLFMGREPFVRTLSVNLQVLAVIHVMSSLAAFLWGTIITALGTGEVTAGLRSLVGETATRKPVYAYFAAQLVLALIYLPLANRRGHKSGLARLQGRVSSRVLSAALARAEAGLFCTTFFALSVVMVELNLINYQVNNVLSRQPEQEELVRRKGTIEEEIRSLQEQNEALRRDVERLRRDPRAREKAARERLNMVRPNEVVVPLD